MIRSKNINGRYAAKTITVLFLFLCLLFLTGINFILYPSYNLVAAVADMNGGETEDTSPSGPVEEKTASASLAEEFLHEHFYLNVALVNNLMLHKIHEAEKLQIVHSELLTPPPESIS